MQKGAAAGKLTFLLCAQFFKDRHYLDKEWGHYIGGKVEEVLQTHNKNLHQNFIDLLHISTVIGGFS